MIMRKDTKEATHQQDSAGFPFPGFWNKLRDFSAARTGPAQ